MSEHQEHNASNEPTSYNAAWDATGCTGMTLYCILRMGSFETMICT